MMRLVVLLFSLLVFNQSVDARPRGVRIASSEVPFNGGNFQLNTNFPSIGGDYPFIDMVKNTAGWEYRDNSGFITPDELDDHGYPLSTSTAIVSRLGVRSNLRMPAQAYIGGNCIPAQAGYCLTKLVNGKGTIPNSANGLITSNSGGGTSTVTTGSTTVITFSQAQDFRAGMEVPVSGTTGVTATNGGGGSLTSGGTTGSFTVCAAGLTSTTIQLCLNDQITPLTTTGTPAGTTNVTYGRINVGVASGGRMVELVNTSPTAINVNISAQDATTPITYRNGRTGLAIMLQGSEEVRYEAGQIFGSKFLTTLIAGAPGVLRSLNTLSTNANHDINWADRKSTTYYSYSAQRHNRGINTPAWAGTTSTAAGTNGHDYTLTYGSGAPTDRQQFIVAFNATAVTVTDSVSTGQPALVTWTGHALQTGSPLYFNTSSGSSSGGLRLSNSSGTSSPVSVASNATTYFAITSCGGPCDANNIRIATNKANALAGTAVSTTGASANMLAQATQAPDTVTTTASNATIAWPNNLLSVGDLVVCDYQTAPYFRAGILKVTTANTNDVQMSLQADPLNTPLVPLTSGSFLCGRAVTINLNGTGKVAIINSNGIGIGLARSDQPKARSNNIILQGVVTYDGVLGAYIKLGADISYGNGMFLSGWPPEMWLELCKQVGAHPWVQPNGMVTDGVAGITDYYPSLVAYYRANAASWMIPRYEVTPNEFWNVNGNFNTGIMIGHAAVYASASLPLYAGASWTVNSGIYEIAGKIGSVLGQAVHNAYGNPTIDGTQGYQTPVGVQTFTFSASSGAFVNAPRMTSAAYVGQTVAAQSPYLKAPASDYATHVSVTIYMSNGLWGSGRTSTLATNYGRGLITGSISGNVLNVTNTGRFGSGNPTFGIGTKLVQGPGIQVGTEVIGGSAPNWTLDRTYTNPVGGTNIATLASTSDPTAIQEFVDSFGYNSQFTGTITNPSACSGGAPSLTVTGITGYINTTNGNGGDFLYGVGTSLANPYIQVTSQLSGTTGGNGTYCIETHANVGPITMKTAGVFSLPSLTTMYTDVAAYAALYPSKDGAPKGLNSYEGGPAIDYADAGASLLDQFYAAMRSVYDSPGKPGEGTYGWTMDNLEIGQALGYEFPSLFQFTGVTPSVSGYSALDDIYMPVPAPIWDAYKDFN